ncbi:MAG: ATP-binding protein [Bacteroidales bacterium]|nr:ATP-binding protein [Bacteroidales bacterium]
MNFERHKPTQTSLEELFELIRKGENEYLDFKHRIDDARKIAKTLSAFANTHGGILLIGVKDNGKIIGVESDEEIFVLDAAANYYARPKIPYSIRLWQVKDKIVVEALIQKSNLAPHFVKNEKNTWCAYARVGDKNIALESIIIHIMKASKQKSTYKLQYGHDEYTVLSVINNKKNVYFSQITELTLLPHNKIINILTTLILLKVVSYTLTENGAVFTINEKFDFEEYNRNRKRF